MKPIKLLAILPYEGLHNLMLDTVASYSNIEIDCYIGDMEDGLKIVQNLELDDYFAIISRAGTATLLANHVSIPVIDIKITVSDMLRAIRLAQGFSGKFAIVGFPTIISYANAVADMLQSPVNIFTVFKQTEIEPCLKHLQNEHYSLIVGDVITTNQAKNLGYNTILITSSSEGIKLALDEAINWYKNFYKLQNKNKLYKKIFDNTNSAILAYDNEENLVYTNTLVQKNLPAFATNLNQYIPTVIEKEFIYLMKKIGSNVWNISAKKINLDDQLIVAFYGDICTDLHKIDKKAFEYNSENLPTVNFSTFQSGNPSMRNLIQTAKTYSSTTQPILITGEKGTGKKSLAYMIYHNSNFCNNMFITIDCQWMNEKSWQIILNSQDSPFSKSGITIYFNNLQLLTNDQQNLLQNYLHNTALHKRNRLIFSYFSNSNEDFNSSNLLYYIRNIVGTLTLHLPTLNSRKEDIPYIATLYLNDFNTSLGKQIMGLMPEAIHALQAFNWQCNIDQFKRIMRQLVILTSGSYIKSETVVATLNAETAVTAGKATSLKITGTLDEITRDIINAVLEEEGMNQSQAAKRLGISRSTLWRKLQ